MKSIPLFIFLFFLIPLGFSQTFESSSLPIIIIETDKVNGQAVEIPDDPKVLAHMTILYRKDGSRNFISDINNSNHHEYNGRIGIEIRGSTSQVLPKKPYGLTTYKSDGESNNNVEIFGFPKENDWILNALAFDPSLIRDYLSYELAAEMGNYASRGRYCEVIVNGDYKGLYVFMEKLKIDEGRIDIEKMNETNIFGKEVTGGFITKADKTTGGDPVAWTMGYTDYIHESPKPEDITNQQDLYIKSVFFKLAERVSAKDESIEMGYASIIDVPSFVDYMLMSELASNADSYQFSTFFHKERGGKLRAGPVWDYNLTFGNDLFIWGYDRSFTDVWQFQFQNTGSKFWREMFYLPSFKCRLSHRWHELNATNGILSKQHIYDKIDSLVAVISEAKDREELRWETVGDHPNHIQIMKTWINGRLTWINGQLNNEDCEHEETPKLVISEINYNPEDSPEFESKELEFIGITNAETHFISLNGVYIKQLGLSYQFPLNSTIDIGETLYLASDSLAFEKHYGIISFGEYFRTLANSSYPIVLANAFGEVIDSVRYSDSSPWPEDADGDGFYLTLTDLNSDNSLAENWKLSSTMTNSLAQNSATTSSDEIQIYPNPSPQFITLRHKSSLIESYTIYDILGREVSTLRQIKANQHRISLQNLISGVYFIRVQFSNSLAITQKIVKIR